MGYDGWVTVATGLDTKELEKDLIETNKRMIEYKELMEKIAFNK